MLFNQVANILKRSSSFAMIQSYNLIRQTVIPLNGNHILSNEPIKNQLTQIRSFRDKDILKLRCNSCYFKMMPDNRWWVLCSKHPRHKQRQKIEDERMSWVVTHITRTGSYKRKHFQYPNQDI